MKQFVVVVLVLVVAVAYVQSLCIHNGIEYKQGDSYLDNCNRCNCGAGGNGLCTKKACPPKVCTYNGKRYGVDEQFMDSDNCNRCTCTSTGVAACTQKVCV